MALYTPSLDLNIAMVVLSWFSIEIWKLVRVEVELAKTYSQAAMEYQGTMFPKVFLSNLNQFEVPIKKKHWYKVQFDMQNLNRQKL